MITKTLPFLLAAALGLSTSVMAQTTATSAKAKPVSLTQQVQDLKATVLQLQKRVDYLEMLVPSVHSRVNAGCQKAFQHSC